MVTKGIIKKLIPIVLTRDLVLKISFLWITIFIRIIRAPTATPVADARASKARNIIIVN